MFFPHLFSGPQFLWGGAVSPLLSFLSPWDFPFPPLCIFLGSIPWQCPPGHAAFISPLHMRASTASILEAYIKVFLKYNIHTKEYIHALFINWMNFHIVRQHVINTPEGPLTPPSGNQHPTETTIFTFNTLDLILNVP